ncbi:pyruvate ferredoxin oxidoreductase [Pseudodesulfovibrio sp. JC047]|uniref:2-oxoacid:acceptor oxidoreductase family protein n=1 Tax=Pseudodesulfovibrio sp. JC047 TaxID=2683199 RepID=UPI0013D74249|nr:2-oxoacid:acceptor oxidoreductase family protein [Pseudodesulfovibrio sp. JC047]NDV18378.1 pyruvate ferredoxin oxidoreductase [Pseudodesulfovibrio sp. JC047]
MERYRFLLSGSGGQGVITMAIIFAEAAALEEGLTAVQSQSYGPEARGGATRSDVIISDSEIYFPKVLQPNYLVALTEEAASKYLPLIRPGGMALYDSSLVTADPKVDAEQIGLPMYHSTIETLGKPVAFNICVLGALATLTGVVKLDSLEKVVRGRFKEAFFPSNQKALQLGENLAQAYMSKA